MRFLFIYIIGIKLFYRGPGLMNKINLPNTNDKFTLLLIFLHLFILINWRIYCIALFQYIVDLKKIKGSFSPETLFGKSVEMRPALST